MNIKKLISEVQDVMDDQKLQYKILSNVASKLGFDDKIPTNADEAGVLRNKIIEAEVHGVTGFDCGLVYVELPSAKSSDFDFIDKPSNITLYFSEFKNAGLFSATLKDFPLNVQSTTIKAIVLDGILDTTKNLKTLLPYVTRMYD